VSEFEVAALLLSGVGEKTRHFLDAARGRIDWPALLHEAVSWSSSERLLVHAARDLWAGDDPVSLRQLVDRLDAQNWQLLLRALALARGQESLP